MSVSLARAHAGAGTAALDTGAAPGEAQVPAFAALLQSCPVVTGPQLAGGEGGLGAPQRRSLEVDLSSPTACMVRRSSSDGVNVDLRGCAVVALLLLMVRLHGEPVQL